MYVKFLKDEMTMFTSYNTQHSQMVYPQKLE